MREVGGPQREALFFPRLFRLYLLVPKYSDNKSKQASTGEGEMKISRRGGDTATREKPEGNPKKILLTCTIWESTATTVNHRSVGTVAIVMGCQQKDC